jgi:hypothetical protein
LKELKKRIRKRSNMIKRIIIISAVVFLLVSAVSAQVKKQDLGPTREITLYNPYKPTLPEARKKNFLPDMSDTIRVTRDFRYEVNAEPFLPAYIISPVKAASLLSDPLPKLYKSFVNMGFGNYYSPLAEISITNERSREGAIGFYGRHFSSNGKVELQNDKKVFAGYMDNDVSLFGRKFFRKNIFESSVDYIEKTRHAYGYDTSITDYNPANKDIRMTYTNIGAKASLTSLTLDSTDLSYDFDIYYNYFYNNKSLYQHSAGFNGMMAKSYLGFYVGSGLSYEYIRLPDALLTDPKYIASISPFIKKSGGQWNVKLGLQLLLDRNMGSSADFHIYPDLNFGFSVVPSYVSFFTGLTGNLEKNDPLKIISDNPFLTRDGSLFTLPNTDHELIVTAGLKGNTGLKGMYLVSASYSLINNMLFYTNISSAILFPDDKGNYFVPLVDDAELLNIHGEMSGAINDKLSFNAVGNFYKYTLSANDFAWNRPGWDTKLGLKYNLKDKIIVGMELSALGKRKLIVDGYLPASFPMPVPVSPLIIETPAHLNLNLSAEYRYSKILSVWARFNNISYNSYYEWAYYPSQRFLCMIGFTYSL